MSTAPLDSLETCLNITRVRLNDSIQSINGDVLIDNAPFTLPTINAAWRRFQERLVDFGMTWFKQEQVFSSVAAVTSSDSASQVYIDWVAYFDGTNPQTTPVLPQNFITPLVLWERPTGSGPFYQMDRLDNGLPAISHTAYNKSWEWRDGKVYMPGATAVTDLRIRYAAFYPDFVLNTTTSFATQLIPILRALNPFAWYICSEVAKARGDVDSSSFDTNAEMSTRLMFNLDPLQAKSVGGDAQYDQMVDQYTPTQGPSGPRGPMKGQ